MLPDKLLINLRILSKIQKNGRITKSTDGIINLEQYVLYKGIKRFIYNDSRRQSLFEINSIIDESEQTFTHLMNNKYMNPSHHNTAEYLKNMEIINLLLQELNEAKIGIENLKFTYKNDQNIISQIDIVIIKINSILKNISFELEKNGNNIIQMNKYIDDEN